MPNQPSNYTRRIGDPNLSFGNVQVGVYIQDDIRPRKNLTLSPGVRYEAQTHVGGAANIGPRFGVTWAPIAQRPDDAARQHRHLLRLAGDRHLRAGAARRRRSPAGAEHLRSVVSGSRRPAAPIPPINRYLLERGYRLPRITRVSAGVDRVS